MIELHFWAALFFVGFVLTDRLILRRAALAVDMLKPIYYQARLVMVVAAGVLVLSGLALFEPHHWLKFLAALVTLVLFFACPWASGHLREPLRRVYRFVVLLGVVATVWLGRL